MVLLQKHLLGGKSTGPNPTDRSKSGTKRSILVDGKGVPIGVSVDGANSHDMKMSKATLQSIVIYRPEPTLTLSVKVKAIQSETDLTTSIPLGKSC